MPRLTRNPRTLATTATLTLLAIVPTVALARRQATTSERASVVHALQGRSYPVKCGVVYISTVNSTWASEEFVGETGRRVPSGCAAYGANGITIMHVEHRRWRAVTAGSSFRCPIVSYPGQPRVPRRVGNDLIRYLHC